MLNRRSRHGKFYGTTTVGEKGQVVIPADARKALKLDKGEKLLVFGFGPDMLALSKLANVERVMAHLSGQLDAIRNMIRKAED